MEKIAFIVDRLNMPPFNKGYNTMTEFDSKSSLELLEICCEIVVAIDPDQADLTHDTTENRVQRIINFLNVMKFSVSDEQMEDFQNLLMSGDKDMLNTIAHWCLQRFESLQKRAYLAKFLMPIDIPPEFMNDDLVISLSGHLKELQSEFKNVHKVADKIQSSGARPLELKAEISQLEQEHAQLQNKIKKMKKEAAGDEAYFQEMLRVTSALRKEQEEEVRIHERVREQRHALAEAEQSYVESSRRLSSLKSSGAQNQSAEQMLSKLQKSVRELVDRKDTLESSISDRSSLLEKLQGWDQSERMTTEDDVRAKRDQVNEMREQVSTLDQRLDGALEKNNKLTVFRQASTMALKKLRDREEEIEKLNEERRKLTKLLEDKEQMLQAQGRANSGKMGKRDLKRYGAQVRDKIEKYKKMREEIAALRAELATLQRTEQILKGKHQHLDAFLSELEKKRGVEGYRETQRVLIEMAEKTAGVDQIKGATLEQISVMVEEINREFKKKSSQLQPLMTELKALKQEYNDLETEYNERKNTFDKVAVGLELEKQNLEKECDDFQEECLREESRYHYLNNLITIAKIKLDRAEQERKWQDKDSKGRMLPDFANIKELYNHKLTQQEQLIKQLRKKQKDLKENSEAMTNQKTNFNHLQALLKLKLRQGDGSGPAPSYGLGSAAGGAGGRGGVYGGREENYESMTF